MLFACVWKQPGIQACARLSPGPAEQDTDALTSPYVFCLAPTALWMSLMSEGGPATRDVPVSTMAWQPPLHAISCLFTMMLAAGREEQTREGLLGLLNLHDTFRLVL